MNERKLFQSITQKAEVKDKKMQINFDLTKIKSKNGITLIALVISIIVMLILAGVSLNATIGDNGIITQAQNATYMQSIAALEEYLQTEYVKYYDESDDYSNKPELLNAKIKNLLLKDGTRDYIIYDGKIYYLINKLSLPEEIKNQLKGGDTNEWAKYIRLQDVYGITSDLKVYYCESGTDSALGTLDNTELDPTTPLKKINQDAEMKSAITEALESIGVTVGEKGVTVGDASKLKNIELDGSKHNITSISGLSELSSLKTVTLSNLTLSNLDGLENCTLLYYVYFKNCKINDYSNLSTILDLQYLYLYLPPSMSEADANAQVNNLGNGLANATELKKLEYFGISGVINMFEGNYSASTSANESTNKFKFNTNIKNNLTNIKMLEKFSNNIKDSIKYAFLNNNSFDSIDSLKDFNNIYEIDLMGNSNLINLNGLENHKNLVYIFAQYCNLENIDGLKGGVNIKYVCLDRNKNLQSLSGIENSKSIDFITVTNCDIVDITALENNISLRYLQLANNSNLQSIIALKNCTGIKKLYLSGNINMIGTEVRDALADPTTHILQNCGSNYSIPSKYNMYFTTLTSYNYSNLGLTDDSDEINSLKNKTNVTRLNLSGNPALSNEKLQEILSTMTGLKVLSLSGCEKLSSIDFIGQGKVTQLVELDLRETNKNLIDLSNLNNYGKNLINLIIDNENIQLNKMQETINNIYKNKGNNMTDESLISNISWQCRGIILLGNIEQYSFDTCYDIIGINCSAQIFSDDLKSGNFIDLSNCKNLKKIEFVRQCGVKFPKELDYVSIDARYKSEYYDFSNTNKIEKLYIGYMQQSDMDFMFSEQKTKDLKVKELIMTGTNGNGLENLKFLKYMGANELNKIVLGYDDGRNMIISSLDGIEECTNLSDLTIIKNIKLNNIEKLENLYSIINLKILNCEKLNSLKGIENLSNLKNLECTGNNISDISYIKNLTSIETINLSRNSVGELVDFSSLSKIKNLNLSDNNILDITKLENLIYEGKTTCVNLNLSNNILQTNTLNGHNNVETLKKLYNAGLRYLDISGNNFTAGSTDELKNLKWTSYKE